MDTQPIANCCPKCQTPLPPDAPQGLCPKCLFAAVATPTEAGQTAGHRTAPPPVEEIAAAFPQLEILEFIGQGGMGFVFKARQPKLDRLVALKILPRSLAADPTFAERFNREAKLLARLNHPGIVAVHDFGVATGRADLPVRQGNEAAQQHRPTNQFYYLLMEFVDGVNLRQAMQAGRFTPDQALAIVPKICEALQFAHNEGILHRDIKPENILLDAKGRVKIADFGIAKLVGNDGRADLLVSQAAQQHRPTEANLTEAGKTLGSPNHMAPEQLEHPGEVDHRADIYSLGVVFYEMLTGELPLGRFAPPSQKSAADPRVDEVVLRALEKERERRQHSAGEVKTQVETIAATPGSAGVPPAEPGVALGSCKTNMDEQADGGTPSAARETRALPKSHFSRTAIRVAVWLVIIGSVLAFALVRNHIAKPTKMPLSATEFLQKLEANQIEHATVSYNPQSRDVAKISGTYYRTDKDGNNIKTEKEVPFIVENALITPNLERKLVRSDKIVFNTPNPMLKAVAYNLLFFAGIGMVILLLLGIIIYVVSRAVKRPVGAPVPPVQKPDRFWRWFAVAVFAMIAIPFLISIVGLLAAIAIPNFVKARAQSQENARRAAVQLTTNLPAAQNLSFGPVVERVLPDQLGGQGPFMNFESGELVVAPNGLVENRFDRTLLIDWLVKAGADASAIAGENGGHQLVSYTRDTCFSEVSPSSWDRMDEGGLLLAWQLAARTNKIVLGNQDLLPRTFVFETRTGIHGLLQITGFTENPRGVKLRYKLVRNAMAATTYYPGDWIWEPNSETLNQVPPIFLLRPSTLPTNFTPFVIQGKDRCLARGQTLRKLITLSWSQADSSRKIIFDTDVPDYKFDFIVAGQSKWWDKLESEITSRFNIFGFAEAGEDGGSKIHYKLVQNANAKTMSALPTPPTSAFQIHLVAEDSEANVSTDTLTNYIDGTHVEQLRLVKEVLMDGAAVEQAGWHVADGQTNFVIGLTEAGSRQFETLTAASLKRRIAVIFQGRILAAPVINSRISTRSLDFAVRWDRKDLERTMNGLNQMKNPAVNLRFGPVQENVLPTIETSWIFLNLRANRLIPTSPPDFESRAFHDWQRKNGADLVATVSDVAATGEKLPSLIGYGMATAQAFAKGLDNNSPADIWYNWNLMVNEPEARSHLTKLPNSGQDTFYFRTSDDTWGVLQITGFTGTPRGVKFRYKLVQNSPSTNSQ